MIPILLVRAVFGNGADGQSATLALRFTGDPALTVSLFHEQAENGTVYNIPNNTKEDLVLRLSDGQSVTLIGRVLGVIVSCGIFEMCIEASQQFGSLLLPRAVYNLLIEQEEGDPQMEPERAQDHVFNASWPMGITPVGRAIVDAMFCQAQERERTK